MPLSRCGKSRGKLVVNKGQSALELPSAPAKPPQLAHQSDNAEDRVALLASATNLVLGLTALLIYVLTKQSYTNRFEDPLIEFFRQNILSIALPLAIGKPLLTSAFGLPSSSWSIVRQRTYQLVRTLLSVALLMVVTLVPLYAAGVQNTIYVYLHDLLALLSSGSKTALNKLTDIKDTVDRLVTFLTSGALGLLFNALISFFASYLANYVYARRQDRANRSK